MIEAKSRSALSTDPAQYRYWVDEKVRFNDVDMQGHVNNVVIGVYFEAGRLAINRLGECPIEPGKGLALAQITINYLAPIAWPAALRIGTQVLSVSERSCTLQQALFVDERCMATCEAVVVSIDLASGRAAPHGQTRKTYLESLR